MNRTKQMQYIVLTLACAALLLIGWGAYTHYTQRTPDSTRTTVTIAVPYTQDASDISESYYFQWLQAESGLTIEFIYLSESYTEAYLELLFAAEPSIVDAIFFTQEDAPSAQTLQRYIDAGYLAPVSDYFTGETYLEQACADFTDYDLQKAITAQDGKVYYMPALTLYSPESYLQTTWININWLETLGLTIPNTVEELTSVLEAFTLYCPDGAALIGSAESEDTFVCNFLMSQFATCDPSNYYFAVGDDGVVTFPPITDAWREGLLYCNTLYQNGILASENFTYSTDQLVSICNDPANCVGMFTAQNLGDIIFKDSPQLLSYFLVVPPLGEDASAVLAPQLPTVGGIISADSPYQAELFTLMDLMCSEEGYFASHFGEYGVDWEYAGSSAISTLGYPAAISIQNTETTTRSPSDQIYGPFITDLYYQDRIAWVGYQVNQAEYLQARAYSTYQMYDAHTQLAYLAYSNTDVDTQAGDALAAYVKQSMIDFATGARDIADDATWESYCAECEALSLASLQAAAQVVYDAQEEPI